MPHHTTSEIRADQVTEGMTVTTNGPITAHRDAEVITRVTPSCENGQDVIELRGTRPGVWILRPDTPVRIVTDR